MLKTMLKVAAAASVIAVPTSGLMAQEIVGGYAQYPAGYCDPMTAENAGVCCAAVNRDEFLSQEEMAYCATNFTGMVEERVPLAMPNPSGQLPDPTAVLGTPEARGNASGLGSGSDADGIGSGTGGTATGGTGTDDAAGTDTAATGDTGTDDTGTSGTETGDGGTGGTETANAGNPGTEPGTDVESGADSEPGQAGEDTGAADSGDGNTGASD